MKKYCLVLFLISLYSYSMNMEISSSDFQKISAIKKQIIQQIHKENIQLIFLGENHKNIQAQNLLAELAVEYIKTTNKKGCILLEIWNDQRPAFDLLNNWQTAKAMDLYYRRFAEVSKLYQKYINNPAADRNDWKMFNHFIEVGYTLIPVDKNFDPDTEIKMLTYIRNLYLGKFSSEKEKEFFKILETDRNIAMANNILPLFQNGDCEVAFFQIGATHMKKEKELSTLVSERLKILNIFAYEKNNEDSSQESCENKVEEFDINICLDVKSKK